MQRLIPFLAGALLGVVCAFVQAGRLAVLGVSVPWGMILSLISLMACARAAAWWAGSRTGSVLLFLGWLVATLGAAVAGPGGDLVISSGARQLTYLTLGAILGAAAAQWPLPAGATASDGHEPADPALAVPSE